VRVKAVEVSITC